MITLSEIPFSGPVRPIDGYGPGYFRVGGERIDGPVIAGPGGLMRWGGIDDLASLLALKGQVDVLLLGMGATVSYPPPTLRAALDEAGIGLEPMDSPAAARTYNVLLSEGRRVAAALLPV